MTTRRPTDDADPARRQRSRSLAIAWGLGILVLIFYAATIVRLGPNALNKDSFGTPLGEPRASSDAAKDPVANPSCKETGAC